MARAWIKVKNLLVTGTTTVIAAGTVLEVTGQTATPSTPAFPMVPRTNSPATLPTARTEIVNFEGVPLEAALDIYKKLTGLELTIASDVDLCAGIYLHITSGADGPTITKLFEQAFLEQAGVVINKNGRAATLTYNGKPVLHRCGADPKAHGVNQ